MKISTTRPSLAGRDRPSSPRPATGPVHAVEVDGPIARAVTLDGRVVTAYRSFVADSPAAALAAWRKATRVGGRVIVTWAGPGIQYRRLGVDRRATGDTLRPLITRAAASELGVSGERDVVAGVRLLDDAGSSTDAPFAVAAFDAATASDLWEHLSDLDDVAVVPHPLVWSEDGLHLSIRWSATTLAAVEGGYPTQYRYLECGGLAALGRRLAGAVAELRDSTDFYGAVRTVATSKALPLGAAGEIVSSWIDELAFSLRQTTNAWAKSGFEIPDALAISGIGARLAQDELERAIGTQSGLVARSDDIATVIDRSRIPVEEDGAAIVALSAAVCPPPEPETGVTNQRAELARLEKARKAKKVRKAGIAAGVAIALSAVVALPLVLADASLSAAKAHLAAEQAAYGSYARYVTVAEQVSSLQAKVAGLDSARVPWAVVVTKLLSAAPAGTVPESVQITMASTASITIVATLPGPNFALASAWLNSLRALGLHATPASLSAPNSGGRAQVTIDISAPAVELAKIAGK